MAVLDLFGLDGRRALVTGANKGLGKAFALALAEAGADVAVTSRTLENAEVTAEEIRAMGRKSLAIQVDVREEAQVREMVAKAERDLGPIDIQVNNAGFGRVNKTLDDLSLEEWSIAIDTNITGTFLCGREMAPLMAKRGGGTMINLASICGFTILQGVPPSPYDASKSGVVALTKAMAVQWGPQGIRVNAIAPGLHLTDPNKRWFSTLPEFYDAVVEATPLKRVADPEELGGLVVFLASDASPFVTGQTIIVDGGYSIWK